MQNDQWTEPDGEEAVEQLSDYLDSVSEERFDPQAADAFLDRIGDTAPECGMHEQEQALRAFWERHGGAAETGGLKVLPKPKRRGWRLTGRIAAVAACVAVCCVVVCQAMGFDVFGIIGRWSEEQFWFERTATPPPVAETLPLPEENGGGGTPAEPGPDQPVRTSYETLERALEDNGFAALAPGWLPEGFALREAEVTRLLSFCTVNAYFENGEENIIFVLRRSEDPDKVISAVYEKDERPVVEYEHDGVHYYIMDNLSRKSVAWRDGLTEGMISGNFTEDEAKKIIDSMGG